MANVVYPDAGLIQILTNIVAPDFHLHLFSNNATPSDSSVLGDFTESVFTGYAVKTLSHGTWVSLGVSSHIGTFAYPTVVFSNTSGAAATVYGFFMTDTTNTILISAGLFDGSPITIPATTGTYAFIPTISDQSEF